MCSKTPLSLRDISPFRGDLASIFLPPLKGEGDRRSGGGVLNKGFGTGLLNCEKIYKILAEKTFQICVYMLK